LQLRLTIKTPPQTTVIRFYSDKHHAPIHATRPGRRPTKNFSEAVVWFTKAAAESPKDPQIKACLGQSLCWLGQREEGLAHLHQSGQLLLKKSRKSRDIGLALDMVDQLQYWNDFPGALALCKQAVQINPGQLRGYQLLALTYSRLNQKKPALAAGRQALKLAPNSAVLSILLATLEAADGLNQEAKQRLEKVLQNSLLTTEERFRANKELARILDKLGQYDQVFPHLLQPPNRRRAYRK